VSLILFPDPNMPPKRRPLGRDVAETVGQRLARLRKERGITQGELAQRLGISQPNISFYETGELRLHADVIIELTHILGVSADELLGLEKAPRPAAVKDRRVLQRLALIDRLPKRDRTALLRTINAFLAQSQGE
jgi:transcriptional regulator with XRE-family HTH domain